MKLDKSMKKLAMTLSELVAAYDEGKFDDRWFDAVVDVVEATKSSQQRHK